MAPEAVVPKKYSFRQRYTKHNYSLVGGDLDDESEEDDDEPVTPAMTAAAAAGLDARALSLMEERDFAHITKGGSGKTAQYLSVRCAHNSQIGSLVPGQTTRDDIKNQNVQRKTSSPPFFFFFPFLLAISTLALLPFSLSLSKRTTRTTTTTTTTATTRTGITSFRCGRRTEGWCSRLRRACPASPWTPPTWFTKPTPGSSNTEASTTVPFRWERGGGNVSMLRRVTMR